MESNKERCVDCQHCTYRNRWLCDLTRWEFSLWGGWCEFFKTKES